MGQVRIAKIGLTGGVAEGKSTVLGYLRDAGLTTASADAAAREVFTSHEAELAELLQRPLPLDRAEMRARMTTDKDLRRSINHLMHRLVVEQLVGQRADVVEVPLLIEACMMSMFDEIWVVTCGPEEQLRRLTSRLGSAEEARRLIATQLPTRVKRVFANEVIRTDQSPADVQNVTRLLAGGRTWTQ